MKGLSLYFLKNSIGANMKKSFRNTCNNEASTSTVPTNMAAMEDEAPRKSVTLEEMILQLDLEEEEVARRRRLRDKQQEPMIAPRRMSCVSNSDMILKSARNAALSQYPRFSLDGKDAMYRSSFAPPPPRQDQRTRRLRVGGESVVWCSPGVVARLMGLEAMPVPVRPRRKRRVKRRSTDLDQMMFLGCAAPPSSSVSSSSNTNTHTRRTTAAAFLDMRSVQAARASFSYMPTR